MKQLFLFILLFTSSQHLSALTFLKDQGGEDKINQIDNQGRKQGKWIYFGKDRPMLGYPPEGKIEEGTYKDDRKNGTWIKYYKDGKTKKLEGLYTNNRPSGKFIKYWPNGEVKEVGTWERNKYKDSLVRKYENGVIEYQALYNESGKETGKVRYYYANGQLEFEYEAVDGIPTGKAIRYYENGDIKEIITYSPDGIPLERIEKEPVKPLVKVDKPGKSREKAPVVSKPVTMGVEFKPNGYNKLYNKNQEIWQDGYFKNGRLWDGKVYEYDADGILLKVKVYKEGEYHSDGQL